MSKKKRAAKLARLSARRELVDGRSAAALARFRAEFPSPYLSEDQRVADHDLFVGMRSAAAQADPDDPGSPGFFENDEYEGDTWLFSELVLDYRDALMKRDESEEDVDARVRFQVADLVVHEIDDSIRGGVGPDHLKIMSVMIRRVPLFPSQATAPDGIDGGRLEVPDLPNPYAVERDYHQDVDLVYEAWKRHYKRPSLPPDFFPPLFVEDDEGLAGAPWIAVFRDLMIAKYCSLEAAEPRIRFVLSQLVRPAVEQRGEDIIVPSSHDRIQPLD